MPTPVSVARQCLTPEAVHALDEAVAVARRRGHSQTTSLHAVSALLSFPSSILREACARARNCAYSPRLQFKALELCLSVSLDRVSSSQLSDDPPVSNSLMAAIKRSQANQRRQPENFHLYHQISQSHNSSAAVVKVELQQLILSILDDPVVSRVFSEAGFRSSEIKLAIVRPLATQFFKFPRSKAPPPIFLCNHSTTDNPEPGSDRRGLNFNFPGFGGFVEGGDENCRRIGDVIVKRENPLLVGVHASGALQSFHQSVERKFKNNNNNNNHHSMLPVELSGLNIISIENDISSFVSENSDKGSVDMKFEELSMFIEQQSLGGAAAGVVVNYGDLKVFVNDNNNNNSNTNNNDDDDDDDGTNNVISHVVAQLTRLLQIHRVEVWLIGCAANYETYMKLVNRFPSIEKEWNLHLLPIASFRPASSMAGTHPKSSLMESFVPLAGFFSTPSEFKSPFGSLYQCASRCHQCTEKCEQEMIALSKGGFPTSIADQYQSSLPSWLQMTEPGVNSGLDGKTKDDGMVLRAKITGLQKKWDDICGRLHHTQQFPSPNIYQMGSQFPTVMGFPFLKDKKKNEDSSSRNANAQPIENSCANVNSVITIDLENMSASKSLSFPVVSKSKNESLPSHPWEKHSKVDLESGGQRSSCSMSNSSVNDGNRTSPTSVTSVTADLGLGMCSAPNINEIQKHADQDHTEPSPELSGCFSANVDFVQGSISNHPAQSSSSSCPDLHWQFDLGNCKALFRALNERVGWQDEAICVICQTIARGRMGYKNCNGKSLRRDIWFNFTGPDRSSKKKIAVALAEIIYGSKENRICADLSSQDGVIDAYTIFDRQDMNGYSMKFRGKTLVDYVAAELCKKPRSVVFLENVDKADVQAQNILFKAIRTGKFSDSYGREVSINNAIFVTTTSMNDSKILTSRKQTRNYPEERILRAKSWLMQILVEPAFGSGRVGQTLATSVTSKDAVFVNKRKLVGRNENQQRLDISEMVKRAHKSSTRGLDLNLPAEEDDQVQDSNDGNSENDSSENSNSWLQDFFDQIETVVFKPFNFDALAEKVSSDINESFHNIVGSECLLEIESKVMEQLLAAAYMSDSNRIVKDWVDKVLNRAFAEVKKRYSLLTDSIVKLVTYEGRVPEEPTPGACLPSEIILN